MLGAGQTPAERKGVDGVTGSNVILDGDFLYADLHIYSDTLKRKIDTNNKKDISIGYRVKTWEKANGLFNGQPYDYIQRGLLGNHVAVVAEGRSGKEVAVLDHTITYDHMDIVEDGSAETKAEIQRLEKKKASEPNAADKNELQEQIDKLKDQLKNTTSDSTASPSVEKTGDADCSKTKGANDMAEEEKKEDKKTTMDDVKAFMKDFAKDRKAFDKLMDEMTPKEKEEAKAQDAEEKPGDQKLAKDADEKKDEKKAEDADEKKDDKKAMDAAIERIAALEKNGLKTLMAALNKRNDLAKTVEAQFGTFDHAELTANEVASYGLKKAGITAPAGAEIAVWDAYSAGRKVNAGQLRVVQDAKDLKAPVGSLIEKSLAASK